MALSPRLAPIIPEEHVGMDPTSNGTLEDFPAELRTQAEAALDAERQSIEKGIDAWKKLVGTAPGAWEPRRELARLYKQAERWKACVEILKLFFRHKTPPDCD